MSTPAIRDAMGRTSWFCCRAQPERSPVPARLCDCPRFHMALGVVPASVAGGA
jgi:hypothetical protein